MGRMKDSIYNFLVRKNKNVQYEYERYVMEHTIEHYENRMKHWKILFKLNWHYRVKKKTEPMMYWDRLQIQKVVKKEDKVKVAKQVITKVEKQDNKNDFVKDNTLQAQRIDPTKLPKGPYRDGAESTVTYRPAPYHFVLDLLQYDVISFDVFDTLLFRPFQNPTDLFNIVGKRLNYPAIFSGYKKARMEAEVEARNEREKKYGTREVNIFEIYQQLEKKIGVSAKIGAEMELLTEMDYLFANPYMQIVYNILRAQGKIIVLTSDMYIPSEYMGEMVKKCGYYGYDKLYVSCDYRCNKRSGELFRRVINDYPNRKIIHIGDNLNADIDGAKKCGLDTWYYKNVNEAGKQFRGEWMSNLTGSAYNGLVNAYLHNGLNKYPFFYEYGFVYGGLYVYGFCQWLEKKAKQDQIEKIIFLARDGDIYQKVYNKFLGNIPNEYVYWSRFANMKYMIELQQDAFIDRVIKQKALGSLKIELSSVFDSFSINLSEDKLKKYGLYNNSIVSCENMDSIKFCIRDNWDDICACYKDERELIVQKIKQLIGTASKIAVIDVGWTGSGPLGFRAFVQEYVSRKCEVKCWMAGGAGSYGTGEYVLPYYMDGVVDAFLFSPFHNRRNESIHLNQNIAANNNAMFEMFTQTQYPSYRGYTGQKYVFDIPEVENYEITAQIHKGIMDFCDLYHKTFTKDTYMYNISGFEAYRPFANVAFHKSYFEINFRDIVFNYGISGDPKNQKIETVGERIERINGGKK